MLMGPERDTWLISVKTTSKKPVFLCNVTHWCSSPSFWNACMLFDHIRLEASAETADPKAFQTREAPCFHILQCVGDLVSPPTALGDNNISDSGIREADAADIAVLEKVGRQVMRRDLPREVPDFCLLRTICALARVWKEYENENRVITRPQNSKTPIFPARCGR